MKSSLVSALLASYALAAPSSRERFTRRLERRDAARRSLPSIPSDGPATLATNETNVVYFTNWAGAAISKTTASGINLVIVT